MEGEQKSSKGGGTVFGVSRQMVERLKKEYPKGTIGTVEFVDDSGQIHTSWEGNGFLALIYGVDEWKKLY